MSGQITKKDLEEILDKKFIKYQAAIIEAVDYKFQKIEAEIAELRTDMRRLITTLDSFLKRLIDREEEFTILKAEMDQVKLILKEKLGVEISILGQR